MAFTKASFVMDVLADAQVYAIFEAYFSGIISRNALEEVSGFPQIGANRQALAKVFNESAALL